MYSRSAARSGLQQLAAVVLQPQISNCCIAGLSVHAGAVSADVGGVKFVSTSSSAHSGEQRSWGVATAGGYDCVREGVETFSYRAGFARGIHLILLQSGPVLYGLCLTYCHEQLVGVTVPISRGVNVKAGIPCCDCD